MLPKVRHFIVNMFISILIVIVNTSKTADVLDLKVNERSFLSKDTRKTLSIKNLSEMF